MVFPATQAQSFTNQTIVSNANNDVQTEISLAEQQIRYATGQGLYDILYNARILGNPIGSPQVSSNLTTNQETFYTLLIDAGYLVSLDIGTGRWSISWSPVGPETLVNIYTFRTTVEPGPVSALTITAIQTFFLNQIPVMHSVAKVVQDGSGNQIQESDFGATDSTFYEYTIVVDQQTLTTDFSSALTTYLTSQALGYSSGNCKTYKMI